MTPEQQEAITAARELLAELPDRPSPELAAGWWAAVRAVLQQVAAAFPAAPEGGQQ